MARARPEEGEGARVPRTRAKRLAGGDRAVGRLQRAMFREYAASVGLGEARYAGGARLRPVVPLANR